MGKLDGKVALISGGARGQGAAEARTFVREGARVVFGDVRDGDGKEVQAQIHAGGGDAVYVHLDVTNEGDWRSAVQVTTDRYGKLDILVNNAGIVIPRVPIDERTVEDWDRVMAVNARGVFLGTKHAIPAMRRAGGGSIVNISSTAGVHSSGGLAYTGSKFAITGLTKTAAHMLGPEKIRINSVHPGWMKTPQTEVVPQEWVASLLPLRTIMDTKEVAKLVSFLASDDSSMVTGSEYLIDAGSLLMGARDIVDRMAEHM